MKNFLNQKLPNILSTSLIAIAIIFFGSLIARAATVTVQNVQLTVKNVHAIVNMRPFPNGYFMRRTITINHNQVASSTGEIYTDFSVLVASTTITSFKHVGQGGKISNRNCWDLVFSTSTIGSGILPYEREKCDPDTGELDAWVKFPSLSTSTDTTFYVFYGNSSINTNTATTTGAWNANFKQIYHLGENGGTYRDSTASAINGTGTNNPIQATGRIGFGQQLSGTNYITMSSMGISGATDYTVSSWASATGSSGGPNDNIWDSTGGGNFTNPIIKIRNDDSKARFEAENAVVASGGNVYNNGFHYIVGTRNGTLYSLYIDGAQVATSTNSASSINSQTNYIGAGPSGSQMVGTIDELKISNNARSADWIKTEYNNQKSNSTFLTIGAEQVGN